MLPEFRLRGLGRALLLRGLAGLEDRGAARASLRVISATHAARALYEALGFVETEAETIWRLELVP